MGSQRDQANWFAAQQRLQVSRTNVFSHWLNMIRSRNNIVEFYKQEIPVESIARAIAYAIEQPDDGDVGKG